MEKNRVGKKKKKKTHLELKLTNHRNELGASQVSNAKRKIFIS
jgi:hypothetical protein